MFSLRTQRLHTCCRGSGVHAEQRAGAAAPSKRCWAARIVLKLGSGEAARMSGGAAAGAASWKAGEHRGRMHANPMVSGVQDRMHERGSGDVRTGSSSADT